MHGRRGTSVTIRSKLADLVTPCSVAITLIGYVPVEVEVLVEIVRVEVNVGFGIPLDGLKDEVAPDGRPFKLSETEEHDPPSRVDVMVMVLVSEFP